MNVQMKSIEARVQKIQRAIDRFKKSWTEANGDFVYGYSISTDPVITSSIENFESYPADYRYFVTEIGNLDISTNDCWSLEMKNPKLDDDDFSMVWCDEPELLTDHLVVATLPCDYSTLAFDTKTLPYSPVELTDRDNPTDFIEYIEAYFQENLELWRAYEET